MTITRSFCWIGCKEIEIGTRHGFFYPVFNSFTLKTKKVAHLHIAPQDVEVQIYSGQDIALKLALAISIELAENKSKRFHRFLPNLQP